MAEALNLVSVISYVLAVVFSIISVFVWIKFRILEIIGDLSGRTAKKSITKMRKTNEKNGARFYKEKLDFEKEGKAKKENDMETGLLYENKESNVSISAQTGLLSGETMEIASTDETTELETIPIKNNFGQSSVIEEIGFELIEEIILVHTDEVTV